MSAETDLIWARAHADASHSRHLYRWPNRWVRKTFRRHGWKVPKFALCDERCTVDYWKGRTYA